MPLKLPKLPQLIAGETVDVLRPSTSYDANMDEVKAWSAPQPVANVAVRPGPAQDLGHDRPDGVRVAYTLAFPRTFSGSLRGCRVRVRGGEFAVVGDPMPDKSSNCPGPWNRTVEVEVVHG